MEARKGKGPQKKRANANGTTDEVKPTLTHSQSNINLLPYAEKYLGIGFPVIPVQTKTKVPFAPWKEFQTSLPTIAWWKDTVKKYPRAAYEMIGLVTGKHSGVIELDFDSPSAVSWFEATVCKLPQTIISKTGRLEGGWGHFYRYPIGIDYVKTRAGVAENIDVRGDGGLAYLPPSLHKTGQRYGWLNVDPLEHGLDDLLELPKEAFEFLEAKGIFSRNGQTGGTSQKSDNKPGWVGDLLLGVKKGSRNSSAAKLAGWYLRAFSGDINETRACLKVWNERNDPPLEAAELNKVIESIKAKEGTRRLSEKIGHEIFNVEILNYPDGEALYNLYVDGKNNAVQMTPRELLTPRLFREKYLVLAKKVIPDIKNRDWFNLIQPVIDEAEEIEMNEDETLLGTIKEIIKREISRGTFDNPEDFIENQVVEWDKRIWLRLDVIARHLQFTPYRVRSKKKLGTLLRKIGFKSQPMQLGEKKDRFWFMAKSDFEKTPST